jgi:hypothetical protein
MSYMLSRRSVPRLGVEAFCTEIVDGKERHALVADVSETGIRIARPYAGGPTPRVVQLEIELPGLDEVLWAKGDVCFDQLRRELGRVVRTTGVRFAAAAARDLRLIRDYVLDLWRDDDDGDGLAWLAASSRYALG